MNPKRVFIGWHKPWVQLVAEWLSAQAEPLRRRLVVVPTRESGRRLREALVIAAARDGLGALLGPRVTTPETFFQPSSGPPDCVRWAAWVRTLREAKDEEVGELFPRGVARQDDGWRLGVARQIEQAREVLAAGNSNFQRVSGVLQEETGRWTELSRLEGRMANFLKSWGYEDPVWAKQERARRPVLPPGVGDIVVACVADPTWLAVQAWANLASREIPIHILIGAPAHLDQAFDEWGRPKPQFWADRIRFSVPEPSKVRVAADPGGVAEAVARACAGRRSSEVAIGVCDAAFGPAIARRMGESGWPTFDPQPAPLARDGWPDLLEGLAEAIESPEHYGAIARVARHWKVWHEWLPGGAARQVFASLSVWEREHCISDSGLAIERLMDPETGRTSPAAGRLLERVYQLAAGVRAGNGELLEGALDGWFAAELPEVAGVAVAERSAWKELGAQGFDLVTRLRWLSASLSGVHRKVESAAGAIALQGWLELPYDPSPHLVLAALHEGVVPETPMANPLLSEAVRERLGLRDRKSRLAREVFLYSALVEGRRSGGSVTVITAQADARGEPCRPSRVLLHVRPEELPRRVLGLVKERPDVPLEPTPRWARGDWFLTPLVETAAVPTWKHLSPSALKSYLECPTRFYLSRVLHWDEFKPFTDELDGARLGDLIHAVLFAWGSDPEARECADAGRLGAWWEAELDRQVHDQFGGDLPAALQLQVMSVRERLRAFAEKQAAVRAAGWRVIEVEKEYEGVVRLAGLPVKMRVDRIDQHEDGRVRVVDYKTAKAALMPRQTHLRVWSEDRCPAALGDFITIRNRPHGWADLQLVLYARTVQSALGLKSVPLAAYALLPEAVGDTAFAEFEKFEERIECGLRWAEEAARRIQAGIFWPPAPEVKFDLFGAIAPDGLELALSPEWVERLKAGPAGKERAAS